MEREGQIQFLEYLFGLGKRLLPNAFIVLLFSTVFSILLLPQVQWRQVISEVYASAMYHQNWRLASNAIDYLAQNNEASPLQHFWALSIQGQFYVTWPIIIFITYIFAIKVLKTPIRKSLLTILMTIFIFSLLYSINITNVNQPWAYFDTFARVWEFSLGGILALLLPYIRLNKVINIGIGWLGLFIIIFTGVLLPVSTVFPGYAALLPIFGVIFIVIAAEQGSHFGVERLLGSKPLIQFGQISYGFYLWHWPLLIFYYAIFNVSTVSFLGGMTILLITFLMSLLSTNLIEAPIRRISVKQSKGFLLPIFILFILPVLIVNTFWSIYLDRSQEVYKQYIEIEKDYISNVTYNHVNSTEIEPQPDINLIAAHLHTINTLPVFYSDYCYVAMNARGMKMCSYGETENPEYVIALVGGSRSGHWFPALEQFAKELKIQIDVYNKDACRFSTQDFGGALSDSCMEWNTLVIEPLLENPPDLIFTTANVDIEATIPKGYIEVWEKFEGITRIFAVRDNPTMQEDIPRCIEVNGPKACTVPREKVLAATPPWENTEGLPSNVYFADLSEYLCDEKVCHAVIDNMLVYRDRFHLSTLFASSLSEPIKEHLIKALAQGESKD